MPNPAGHLECRQVIDGQQRLTTLQLLLEAFVDICARREIPRYDRALMNLTRNDDPISDDPDDEFKVWPTNADQQHFRRVMRAETPDAVKSAYSASKRGAGHPIADAYLHFHAAIDGWLGNGDDVEERVKALYDTLRNQVRVVAINLTTDDDPQVIFETLNARGTPLLPSDLVKNFLFHRLSQNGADVGGLYDKFWRPFDEDAAYWRRESGRGHARRPAIDTFLQHYLASQLVDEVPVAHLFTTYREYAGARPSLMDELGDVQRLANLYRGFHTFDPRTSEGRFFRRLGEMNVTSAYPFLLRLFDRQRDRDVLQSIMEALESFLVRRLVARLSTRGYARLFVEVLQALDDDRPVESVLEYLRGSPADFRRWPDDAEFLQAWRTNPVYRTLQKRRVRMLLEALEDGKRTRKSEKLDFRERLTIEHLLPRKWQDHYPMPDGAGPEESAARQELKNTLGNLTLLTKSLNPAVSNGPWPRKQAQILKHSALALNRDLDEEDIWDDAAIDRRARQLFQFATQVWPGPRSQFSR
jgi:hypothetical protein